MKKVGWILIFVGLLVGCGQEVTQTPELSTVTKIPTKTNTPASTITQIPTPTEIQRIDFPAWVADPETSVLLVGTVKRDNEYENLALFNTSTGERFVIPYMNSRVYFWTQNGQHIGLLSQDKKEIKLINIQSGEITLHNVDEEAIKLAGMDNLSFGEIDSDDFLLIHSGINLSNNRRYLERRYSIYDIKTDQEIEMSDPKRQVYVFDSKWSPVAPLLGVAYNHDRVDP